jgi:hypothetical protein
MKFIHHFKTVSAANGVDRNGIKIRFSFNKMSERNLKQLMKEYPNSKVTLLETPLYSIARYNQFKGFKSSSKQGEKNKPSFDHN